MTEEGWRMNPILVHIIDDFIEEGFNEDKAIDGATKIFSKIPKDKRELDDKPFTCPYCGTTFQTEREDDN